MMRNLLPLLVSLLLWMPASGQGPKIKTIDAVPKNAGYRIACIQQDTQDFIWLGTNKGLFKFNGIASEFIPLPKGIESTDITSLHIRNSTLLAGFANGQAMALSLVDPLQNQRQFAIFKSPITSCIIDINGHFWLASETEGAVVIRSDEILDLSALLPDLSIHCLVEKNNCIFAGSDAGLIRIPLSRTNNYQPELLSLSNGISDQMVTHLVSANSNALWVGGQSGTLDYFDTEQNSFVAIALSNQAFTNEWVVLFNLHSQLYAINTAHQLFTVTWPDIQNIQNSQLELPKTHTIKNAWIDKNGQLLICTGHQNLFLANLELTFITEHDQISFSNARALTSDAKGNIWFSNEEGIFKHSLILGTQHIAEKMFEKPSGTSDIISICEGRENEIWFGTFGHGVGKINSVTKKTSFFTEKDGLANNSVLAIAQDSQFLWLATLAGVSRFNYDKSSFENFNSSSGLTKSYVFCLFRDKKNNMWLGTDGNGPVKFDGKTFIYLKKQFPLLEKSIVAIQEDSLGQMWFCSSNGQIGVIHNNTFQALTLVENEQNPEVLAMEYDGKNHIIVLTSAGLGKLNILNKSFQFITNNENFNSNFLNVISRDRLQHVWIGTEQTMLRYNAIASEVSAKPTTQIQNVLVLLQTIDTLKHTFAHNENHFTFHVAGIWLKDPSAVQFEYKLDGFNLDWVKTRDQTIVFSKLPPGEYTFFVRSYLGNSPLNSIVKKYSFIILQPIWQRPIFLFFCLIILTSGIFLMVQFRLKNIKKKEAVKQELFKSQLQTLRNQVNPHFLFNSFNTLISSISVSKEDGIDYVEKLSDYFRIVLEQRDKDFIAVKEELDFVRTYFFLQQKRFGENLIVDIQVDDDAMRSIIPPMTLQILAENAIKHNIISKAKPLVISITSTTDQLVIINNIQEKLNKDKSTGVGLSNIMNRYDILFSRKIDIEKTNGQFKICLPLIHHD